MEKTIHSELYGMKRRDFFKIMGGGIFIFFQPLEPFEIFDYQQQRRSLTTEFNAFLQIAEDGSVNCFTGKIEMGQGAITSLPQIMADELDVPYEKVNMVMGDTLLCPYDGGTNGSQTIRTFSRFMIIAAAEARSVLLQMASENLKVPVTQLMTENGIISDIKNNRNRVSYGELTKGKRIERNIEGKPALKESGKYRYTGKPYLHQDAKLKVTGEAKYSGDIKFPGLLHARILRPPSHGAKLSSADVSEAEKMKSVKVLRDGDLVAVLSEDRDMADQAISKVKVVYTFNEINVNDKTIFDRIL
jgi:nicotinate dehydrogenase subunit B